MYRLDTYVCWTMFTTIRLVNTSLASHNYILLLLLWWEILTSVSFSNFQTWNCYMVLHKLDFPGSASDKESPCQCRRWKTWGLDLWAGKIPWRRAWQPSPVSLPGESHGQRSLEGYSPWSRKESDTTERLTYTHTHTHIHTKSYYLILILVVGGCAARQDPFNVMGKGGWMIKTPLCSKWHNWELHSKMINLLYLKCHRLRNIGWSGHFCIDRGWETAKTKVKY